MMIRRILTVLLLATLMLPVFGALGSHDFKHAIHAAYEAHHSGNKHEHTPHNHSESENQPQHHPIDGNLVSFFKDYLHTDLQIFSQKNNMLKKVQKKMGNNYIILLSTSYPEITLQFKQEPPGALSRNDLYLKTQRLRIGV